MDVERAHLHIWESKKNRICTLALALTARAPIAAVCVVRVGVGRDRPRGRRLAGASIWRATSSGDDVSTSPASSPRPAGRTAGGRAAAGARVPP